MFYVFFFPFQIKILLPPQLEKKHHILFTFHHVSVEQPKESKEKKKELLTPVGYAWMPILENQVIRGDENNLPVALYLPENYMFTGETSSTTSSVLGGVTANGGAGKTATVSNSGPDIKWADGKGQKLFKVNTKLVSTIYSQVCSLTLLILVFLEISGNIIYAILCCVLFAQLEKYPKLQLLL